MLPATEFHARVEQVRCLNTRRLGKLLYGLVRWLQPESCVEIGSAHGYTAAWVARALQENGGGQLTCIEDFSLEDSASQLFYNLGALGIDNVAVVRGDSANADNWPAKVDFAFIDGLHSLEACRADFAKADERGARCIVLHDTTDWWGPREFIDTPQPGWTLIRADHDGGAAVFMRVQQLGDVRYAKAEFPSGAIR